MHKIEATVVVCMDFRFQKAVSKMIGDLGLTGKSDLISVAGASRDIVAPKERFHYDAIMREIDLSVSLHSPDEIIVCDHEDCGAYKDLIPDGTSSADDLELHQDFLSRAEEILKKVYPGLEIRKMYITKDMEVKSF